MPDSPIDRVVKKLAAGEDVIMQPIGDTTIDGNHYYGWYIDDDGNRVEFDEWFE